MPRLLYALVVDDSGLSRKVTMKSLTETGLADFRFTEAVDGVDALAKFQPDDTDIIFVDLNMPRMGGIEFMRQLRAAHAKCPPSVLITGEETPEQLEKAINSAGIDALLVKPIDTDRLRSGLRRLIDSIPERGGSWTVTHGECVAHGLQIVLEGTYGLRLTPTSPPAAETSADLVFGMITILGDIQWSVVLGFEAMSAAGVASALAGYEIPFESADLGDAIGEVTNIIGGQIRGLLFERGLHVEVSLPTVIAASQIRFLVQRGKRTRTDQVHYLTPVGRVWVGVSVGVSSGLIM